MFKNVTLLLLHLTSLTSKSALFSPAAFSQPSYYTFQQIYMSKHYSSFLDISANRVSSAISNSKFNCFLNSVIHIHQDELPLVEGVSDQDNNPANPKTSFACNHTSFTRNTSPFNGAAILVHSNMNSINSINAQIDHTNFIENSALMGGAIYFESFSLNMTDSHFEKNSAQIGSHIFLSCSATSTINSCSYQEGYMADKAKSISTIELTAPEIQGSYIFNLCQFFLNKGPFKVNGVSATLTSCCFMDFQGENYGKFEQADYEFFIGSVNLNKVTLNDKYCPSYVGSNPPTEGLQNAGPQDPSCQLIPYPTITSNYKISDEPAIFALVAIIFFVLVSIIGIFIVTCKKKKDVPPDQEGVDEPLKAKK
ncbi:hypothetical protein M9Y10_029393 [Tritrichomonas musculus]|uniref:Right handed beta helix domain-containing protein n=1 Tax=Tritrichomonas musculus TaxID=1915356 RepID=A0ABR2KM12_9EUKA